MMKPPPGPRMPVPGRPAGKRPERLLLLCYYDPRGVSTVCENIAYLQRFSRFAVEVHNFFGKAWPYRLPRELDWSSYVGLIIHNTLSYNVEVLEELDETLHARLDEFGGVKVLMKQDENFRALRTARWIGSRRFDLVLTCVDEAERPKVYPGKLAGKPAFMQMLTGYVTPEMRAMRFSQDDRRPVDIGYRGSIQPLTFGRLAYEKRQIGDAVESLAKRHGLVTDISSRSEDRFAGAAWTHFLARCKATLGAESGASIFDLDGSVEERYREIVAREGERLDDPEWCERLLAVVAPLENNVRYAQVSPRHFEAAAIRTVQILYEGSYSGILQPWRHYWPLRRDLSNFGEIVERLRDPRKRRETSEAAFDEIIANPSWWVETFVARLDERMEALIEEKGRMRTRLVVSAPAVRHVLLLAPHRLHLDPRLGWLAEHAQGGILVHSIGVHADAALPPHSVTQDERGGFRIEVARSSDPTDWMPGMNADDVDFGAGRAALALLDAVRRLDRAALADRFGLDPTTRRDEDFLWLVRYFECTAAALIKVGLSFEHIDAIVAADLDTLAAGVVLKDLLGVPLLYDAHEYWPESYPTFSEWETRFWRNWERILVDRVDAAFCVSAPLAEYMQHIYGSAFVTVPNCEPLRNNERGQSPAGDARRAPASASGQFVRFLYQGIFAPGRGLEAVIGLWPRTDSRALLLLRGPRQTYTQTLERLAAETGLLGKRILFLDPVSEDELVSAAAQADVGLLPYEPINVNNRYCCPNKVSQYCAAGLAVLSNRLDYVESLIVAGGFGLVADLSNAEAFAAAVDRLAGDASLRARMGRAAREFHEHHFHWQRAARPLYQALETLTKATVSDAAVPAAVAFEFEPPRPVWNKSPWEAQRAAPVPVAPATGNQAVEVTREGGGRRGVRKRVQALRELAATPGTNHWLLKHAVTAWRILPPGLRRRILAALQ